MSTTAEKTDCLKRLRLWFRVWGSGLGVEGLWFIEAVQGSCPRFWAQFCGGVEQSFEQVLCFACWPYAISIYSLLEGFSVQGLRFRA